MCKFAFLASLLSLILFIYTPQSAHAGTTTADFLKWERKAQISYFDISVSMAGVIAAQSKSDVAKCIDAWYFNSEELKNQRIQEILKAMPEFASYHPSSVILAFIEQACGEI